MSSEQTFQDSTPSDKQELHGDAGLSFVIRRRNGDEYTVRVSEEDYDLVVSSGPWSIQAPRCARHAFYVFRMVRKPNGQRTCQYLHRFLLSVFDHRVVDHVNGSGLDNRRSNLRIASFSDNSCNIGKRSNNTSSFKGVSWCKREKKWRSLITFRGRGYHLGMFASAEEASAAYRDAAIRLHGEFARF